MRRKRTIQLPFSNINIRASRVHPTEKVKERVDEVRMKRSWNRRRKDGGEIE